MDSKNLNKRLLHVTTISVMTISVITMVMVPYAVANDRDFGDPYLNTHLSGLSDDQIKTCLSLATASAFKAGDVRANKGTYRVGAAKCANRIKAGDPVPRTTRTAPWQIGDERVKLHEDNDKKNSIIWATKLFFEQVRF